VSELRTAALLHDIGKIGTYDYLLDKTERLTEEEFEFVKKHPEKSARILEPISRFEPIIDIIKCHHEQYDGSGYPYGLKGEGIPLMARVLCVADCYDSMTADRPYRRAQGREYAISELRRCSGTQFDPEMVKVFIGLLENGIE
jgi:putative nucleotidyltransferase with HDIG domain